MGRFTLIPKEPIPDAIFNSGKSSDNTNKENSQRITIVCAKSSQEKLIETTDLLRWRHFDRDLLFQKMTFATSTDVCSSFQFPRMGNELLASFWRVFQKSNRTILDLSKAIFSEAQRPLDDEVFLTVPRATRYFISATPGSMARNKVLSISFNSKDDMDLARVLINSNVFFWYWRVFGDGFLLNVDVLSKFPVANDVDSEYIDLAERLDQSLPYCTTFKMFRGERIPNYNFNRRMDLLLDIDAWIVKHVAPDISLPHDIFAQYKSNSFLRSLDFSALVEVEEPETEDV